MQRLTKQIENRFYLPVEYLQQDEQGYSGKAIEKLAALENLHEKLLLEQSEFSTKLEQLRQEGKKNSVQFRELMGKKLMNSHVLTLFELYGL